MRQWVWLVLAVAGCGSGRSYQMTDGEREIKRQFEEWRECVIRMDQPKIWAGMSVGMKSDWLFERLSDTKDENFPAYRRELKGAADQDLEIWFLENKRAMGRRTDIRPTGLPGTVLATPWLYKVFTLYFDQRRDVIVREFRGLEVFQVAQDERGATVSVRNPQAGGSDRYVMVWESGWKVDRNITPQPYSPNR